MSECLIYQLKPGTTVVRDHGNLSMLCIPLASYFMLAYHIHVMGMHISFIFDAHRSVASIVTNLLPSG